MFISSALPSSSNVTMPYGEVRRIIGFATMIRDISKTCALREALRRSEKRISLIMSSFVHYPT